MKALVLDFDGVISDSSGEAFVVALRTWTELEPGSRLVAALGRNGADHTVPDVAAEPLCRAFRDLIPLGNRAEDFGVALRALEQGTAIHDQAGYDAFRAGQDPAWLDRFHGRFYAHRAALREESLAHWTQLQKPYTPFLALLRRRSSDVPLAIATAKDGLSVRILLEHYGVADLFPDGMVMDKETGRSKCAHLAAIQARLGLAWGEITFVDDRVNHLQQVAGLGVRPVLAAWGHNTSREHALARDLGYPVAAIGDAEAVIFGGQRGA
jgi:phosphoglycolate phosphatase-like HAD superfamily hydrolase